MKTLNNSLKLVDWKEGEAKNACVFVLTRFNLCFNLSHFKHSKFGIPTHTQKWLEERFDLFDKYCFPSLLDQTDKGYIWICMFDINTPFQFYKKIKTYRELLPCFLPLFMTTEEAMNLGELLIPVIKRNHTSDTNLITIRLDNDDALNIHYVKRIKSIAQQFKSVNHVISFKYGAQYYPNKNLAFRIPYTDNHFLTLFVSNKEKCKVFHVLQFDHSVKEKYPYPLYVINNKKDVMWLEVIHNNNVGNEIKMTMNQIPIGKENYLYEWFNVKQALVGDWKSYIFFLVPRLLRFAFLKCKKKISRKNHY